MLAKTIATGLVASVLLASTAFAQTAQTPTTNSERADTAQTVASPSVQGDWRASKVVGLNVYNDNNQNVGSINDLLMDKTGNIKTAVLSVGGLLGVGSQLVAIPFDKIKFVNEPVAYTGASNVPNAPNADNRPATTTTTGSATTSSSTTSTSKTNTWYPDHALLNVTKDELKSMAEFKYSE
jgi:sporulation protein YlmC with PRC-barrel domain